MSEPLEAADANLENTQAEEAAESEDKNKTSAYSFYSNNISHT